MERHPCRNFTSAFKKPVMHDTCWARTCICTLFLTSVWQWPDMLHKWIEHEAHIVSFVSSRCAVCQLPSFVNVVSVICLPSRCGWTGLTKTGSSIRVCANDLHGWYLITDRWRGHCSCNDGPPQRTRTRHDRIRCRTKKNKNALALVYCARPHSVLAISNSRSTIWTLRYLFYTIYLAIFLYQCALLLAQTQR